MKKNSVVIIGAGLGGLECGYILAKNGMKVTIVESESQIGGCIQTFRRGEALFDTGFHYIGSMGEGESLNRLFRYFDLLNLPWKKLDEDCFDEVIIGDRAFAFANGYDRFVDTLAAQFPKERKALEKYTTFLKNVGDHLFDSLNPRTEETFYSTSLFSQSAYDFLNETIQDPLLRKVLSGTSLKMELRAESLPLYTFAQINDSFLRSAWRLQGGGSLIADKLAESIKRMGGEIQTNTAVTSIKEENGQVAGVEVNHKEFIEADWVISSMHPADTVALMGESKNMRSIYRRRITNLANTFGMFTANIKLKPDSMPYLNRNIYIHKADADLWNVQPSKTESVLVNYAVPKGVEKSTISIDLLSPMSWQEVAQWADKPIGKRGEDYVAYKQEKIEQCLSLVEKRLPELRDAIDHIYTSTPLSYYSYTSSAEGCAYGIRKDYRSPMLTVLTPRTPVPHLLQTGQSLNLHGILGVTMTSLFTCAEIIGMETIQKEITNI